MECANIKKVEKVGEYARKLASVLVETGDTLNMFKLGAAWGVYSAIEILDGDFHIDSELKRMFIQVYTEENENTYFTDLVRIHQS